MDWLGKVAQHHKEYIRYAQKMGCGVHSEDLVQEAYIRLHKYSSEDKVINSDGFVNKSYVWRVIFSVWMQYYKDSKKIKRVDIDLVISDVTSDYNEYDEMSYHTIVEKMYNALNDLDQDGYPYNKEMFLLYAKSDKSMRKISSDTNISLTSIFNTIKNCKKEIKQSIGEDFEDYLNKDFELI